MRILSITAGAAGMYCGSCLRDNALAIELIARGHDVTLLPVYTPTLTDDENVSRRDVLFGGISVYLQQHSTLFRKLPRFLDRLWDSPRVIGMFAGRGISPDARFLGEMTVSMLQGESGVLRKGRTSPFPTSSTCPIRCSSRWRRRSSEPWAVRCASRCREKNYSSTRSWRRIASRRSR
jgi:hypothetical protein